MSVCVGTYVCVGVCVCIYRGETISSYPYLDGVMDLSEKERTNQETVKHHYRQHKEDLRGKKTRGEKSVDFKDEDTL